jgi:site-specific DNA-methyltransferase (adenine-specific)/modification methylase
VTKQAVASGEGWTLIHGDCLQVLPTLEAGSVDAVITDPPYGISYNPKGGNSKARRGNLAPILGDGEPFDPSPWLRFPIVVLWGSNHYADRLPAKDSWLVWYKRRDIPSINFADCEMAWTNVGGPARVFDHRWHGMIRDSEMGQKRVHPTQKPVSLMEWCLDMAKVPRGATVLDPFAGSGTTGVACLQTGRRFIGIELDAAYFEVARQRLEAVSAQARLAV